MPKKLTRKQIVEVAKDVLKQIKARSFVPKKGVYIKLPAAKLRALAKDKEKGDKIEVQDLLKASKLKNCQACARGAMVLSKARLFNDAKAEVFSYWGSPKTLALADFGDEHSEEVFGGLGFQVEACFEGFRTSMFHEEHGVDYEASFSYFREFPDATERLTALMKNIIRNNGQFKPGQDLPKGWEKAYVD